MITLCFNVSSLLPVAYIVFNPVYSTLLYKTIQCTSINIFPDIMMVLGTPGDTRAYALKINIETLGASGVVQLGWRD